jgi:CBS domain-containing protein
MTDHVHYCLEDEDTDDVTRKMADSQVRRLPVVDRDTRSGSRGRRRAVPMARMEEDSR